MPENSYTSSFKDIIFIILKLIFFILFLTPVILFIGNKYASASTENLINQNNQRRFDDFYSMPKNSIDMIFLGSSHSYCTFDPQIFESQLGITSFQMGMPLQHPDSTYYTLLEVLNYQKPKMIILEVYWDMLDDKFELKQADTLFQVMNNKELEKKYIKEVFPLSEKIKYDVDILKYQQDYFAYRNNILKKKIENKFNISEYEKEKQVGVDRYDTKGYIYCDYNMLTDEYDKTNQFKNLNGMDWKMENSQKKYLQKIVDLCKRRNIELIFVTAPIANVSMEKIKNYDYIHKTINKFAKDNNINYIDYNIINIEENLLTNDNFRDDAHLNRSGVEIVNPHFINWLKNIGY